MTPNPSAVSNPPEGQASNIQRVSTGLTREWLYDRSVVIYKLSDARRETIDAWIDAFREDITPWPVERPFLVIHDFNVKNVISTPYGRARAQELVDMRPEIHGRAAIVFPRNSIMITMIQIFLSRQRNPARRQQVFPTREQAVAWLVGSETLSKSR